MAFHDVLDFASEVGAVFLFGLCGVGVEGAVYVNCETWADLAFAAGFLIGGGHSENG